MLRLLWICDYVVPSVGDQNQESWRLLDKALIAKIAKLRTPVSKGLDHFMCFDIFWGFVLVGQLAGAGSVAVGVGDR